MSVYTPNTPQATQTIAFTQPLIEANFQYINTAMQVDHTFNGNQLSTEAAGSHQRLDMPNQSVDIAAKPTGIAAVIYALGGNLFSYNGSKQPVSGVTGTGTITITTSAQTVITIPANTMGVITFSDSGVITPAGSFYIFCSSPIGPPPIFAAWIGQLVNTTATPLLANMAGLALQIRRTSGVNFTSFYKYLYWPI